MRMPSEITIKVNGHTFSVPVGATVAVAMALAGSKCRTSVSGELRGPLCGIGICFECRVNINGRPHCKSCQILCEPDMEVSSED
jgi:aerobic-type carbon monoxide dehydrogenase small subunit (CoxS/CutS family)